MSKDNKLENVGFEHPVRRERVLTHRRLALAQLIATVALVFSILIAATAVSFGIARADASTTMTTSRNVPLAPGRINQPR